MLATDVDPRGAFPTPRGVDSRLCQRYSEVLFSLIPSAKKIPACFDANAGPGTFAAAELPREGRRGMETPPSHNAT